VTVVVSLIIVLFIEMTLGIAGSIITGLPVFLWTVLIFTLIWALSLIGVLLLWASNSYVLRQDGLEVRRGIIRLHSFVVTPSGFGDMMVYQGVGGRIFGYGDLTVNSAGERQTKMSLVRSPFATADTIRDVMGKPIVRVEDHP
jgi:membrane protein YdbS with pleckstrin-like domain